MKRPALVAIAWMIPVCALGTSLGGCRAESEMSKDEAANFKGGPPPPGFNPGVSTPPPAASRQPAPR